MKKVDYKILYTDIIAKKHPEKMRECDNLLNKEHLSVVDILLLNKKIFGESKCTDFRLNQKFKSYSKQDIVHILAYQKKHALNNTELANKFKTSRNTIAKWKKIFIV